MDADEELRMALRQTADAVTVDPEAGLARHRATIEARRRRTPLVAVAAAAVVVALAGVIAASRGGSDEPLEVQSPSSTTEADPELVSTTTAVDAVDPPVASSTLPPDTAPAPDVPVSSPTSTTVVEAVDDDGVVLTLTLGRSDIAVGERLAVTIEARNDTGAPVYWQAGGCRVAFSGVLAPAGAEPAGPVAGPTPDQWDGEVAGLAAWLDEHNLEPVQQGLQDAGATAIRGGRACSADFAAAELAPGATLAEQHSVEVRALPGPLPAEGDLVVHATFPAFSDPELAAPLAAIDASAPVHVTEHPDREASSDAAVAAFSDDGRLRSWLDLTRSTGNGELTQSWGTTLSWWRGTWELWVTPYWSHCESLRMRYDPAPQQVVDVRSVQCGRPAHDEPGAAVQADDRPDVIYP